MDSYSIQPILDSAAQVIQACEVPGRPGCFKRSLASDPVPDAQATAAAVNCHHMLDALPWEPALRLQRIEALMGFQEEESGSFGPGPHSVVLSAACTAALKCFGCRPAHRIREVETFLDPSELNSFLNGLQWCKEPEASGRMAAAVFTMLVLSHQADSGWRDNFLAWVRDQTDEHTGLVRRGCIAPVDVEGEWTLLPYLCGTFYLLMTGSYAHQERAMPWRLIDTALEVMDFHRDLFFRRRGHRHLPWIISLTRSMRVTAHRFEESRQSLQRFVPAYLDYLHRQIQEKRFQSPGQIQWDLAALAELQLSLPGLLVSDQPLRQVLNRHPFL